MKPGRRFMCYLCVLACTVGCNGAVDKTLVKSAGSPSGRLNLTVTSWDVGATASNAYHFELTRAGLLSRESAEVLVLDKLANDRDIRIKWLSDNEVLIQIPEARVFAKYERVTLDGHPVTVTLRIPNRL